MRWGGEGVLGTGVCVVCEGMCGDWGGVLLLLLPLIALATFIWTCAEQQAYTCLVPCWCLHVQHVKVFANARVHA